MKNLWRVGKKEIEYVSQAIEKGLTGEFNQRLETEFAKRFDSKYAIGVNSGTSALHTALYAMGVEKGDEVITTPLTFSSTGFSPIYLGATPIFVDIDRETFNIDPKKIEEAITQKTKVIMPVSLYGLPANLEEIVKIANSHGISVLEDNAQCYLGTINGKIAGTFGDAAIFSFERSKHMTSGNGGIIITSNEEIAEKARQFSILGYSTFKADTHATKPSKSVIQNPNFERHLMVAPNYRLPEVCAAMALAQLENIDHLVGMRKKCGEAYSNAVEGTEWIHPQKTPEEYENSYFAYTFAVDTNKISWDEFRQIFLEEGGEPFYASWKLTYDEPAFKEMTPKTPNWGHHISTDCPIAEDLQPRLIQLKTNFGSNEKIEEQARALKRTIERLK